MQMEEKALPLVKLCERVTKETEAREGSREKHT